MLCYTYKVDIRPDVQIRQNVLMLFKNGEYTKIQTAAALPIRLRIDHNKAISLSPWGFGGLSKPTSRCACIVGFQYLCSEAAVEFGIGGVPLTLP